MPTAARIGPYRFFFYSNEGTEPPHIHVQRDRDLAKFWLEPVALAGVTGFRARELTRIEKLVVENDQRFLVCLYPKRDFHYQKNQQKFLTPPSSLCCNAYAR